MSRALVRSGLVGAAVLLLAGLALLGLGGAIPLDGLPLLGRKPPPATILLSGNIEAHESQLSFKSVQSRIVKLPFEEGQAVRAGDVIAAVDDRDLAQQVAVGEAAVEVQSRQLKAAVKNLEAARRVVDADQAELAQRQADLARSRELQQQGFVSTAALQQADTAVRQAAAALARDRALVEVAERNVSVAQASTHSAQQSLGLSRVVAGYATLRAPFDGVIIARQAELGEVVAPGTPVVTMADLDHVWVRAYLNERDLGRIALGEQAQVTTDSHPDRRFQGRVSFIASQAEYTPRSVETHAERVTLVYRIKVDIANPEHLLLPGMPVDVRLAALLP